MTGWPANPKLVRHLKSTLIWTGVHVDEAVMGLSVHTDEDGGGDNPLLNLRTSFVSAVEAPQTPNAEGPRDHRGRRGAARWRDGPAGTTQLLHCSTVFIRVVHCTTM